MPYSDVNLCADVPPEVGSIHHARVVSVRPFGAFVDLPGYRKQALIHSSQVTLSLFFFVSNFLFRFCCWGACWAPSQLTSLQQLVLFSGTFLNVMSVFPVAPACPPASSRSPRRSSLGGRRRMR
jgi:hypothetical protein